MKVSGGKKGSSKMRLTQDQWFIIVSNFISTISGAIIAVLSDCFKNRNKVKVYVDDFTTMIPVNDEGTKEIKFWRAEIFNKDHPMSIKIEVYRYGNESLYWYDCLLTRPFIGKFLKLEKIGTCDLSNPEKTSTPTEYYKLCPINTEVVLIFKDNDGVYLKVKDGTTPIWKPGKYCLKCYSGNELIIRKKLIIPKEEFLSLVNIQPNL